VLGRDEKKLLTAQLRLLAALVKVDPGQAVKVGNLIADMVETLSPGARPDTRTLIRLDCA